MSRRKGRYERRQQKREAKKQHLKQYDDFNNVISLTSMYKSAKKAACGVSWKASVQRYILAILFRITHTRQDLLKEKDIRQGFIEFDINERGKVRHIKSVHFNERVVQKSICLNAMNPILLNSVIYDNAASQKGKGTHFALNRVTEYLHWHYRHYGNKGYVLSIDFKSYFESIPHDVLKENFRRKFKDTKIIKLLDDFVDAFGERGLGLGSETSQINAVVHTDRIDHYIKEVERIKGFRKYMDDNIIIHPDKGYLQELLWELKDLYAEVGVTLNQKKTHISDLKHGFTFLKTRFFLTDTGKVIKKPCRERITAARRKLKKQAKLYHQGIMTLDDIKQSYISTRGSFVHKNARRTIHNMDMLYKKLFEKEYKDDTGNTGNEAKQDTGVCRSVTAEG